MAILGHRPQDIGQAGAEALRVLPVHAVGQGDLVGRLEADAVDFSDHAVRFFRQDVVDVVAVFLQEPAGITAGDAVLFQVIGDVVDLFFFIEGFRNDGQLLRPMPSTSRSRCGSFSNIFIVSLPKLRRRGGPGPVPCP